DQAHVFEPYWQADPRSRTGLGLGLSITKGVVEAHRGRGWFERAEGGGTTFFVGLPGLVDRAPDETQLCTATTSTKLKACLRSRSFFPNQASRPQRGENFFDALFDSFQIAANQRIWISRCLVRIRDSGEVRELASERSSVQSLNIPFDQSVQRRVDVH